MVAQNLYLYSPQNLNTHDTLFYYLNTIYACGKKFKPNSQTIGIDIGRVSIFELLEHFRASLELRANEHQMNICRLPSTRKQLYLVYT